MRKIIILSLGVIALLAVILFASLYQKNESGITTNIMPAVSPSIQNNPSTQYDHVTPVLEQGSTLSPSMQLINLPENKHIQDFISAHGGLSAMTNEQKNEVRTMLNIYKASIRK